MPSLPSLTLTLTLTLTLIGSQVYAVLTKVCAVRRLKGIVQASLPSLLPRCVGRYRFKWTT